LVLTRLLPTYFLESVIGNGFDQTVPETEIEQLDIGIHAEL
jgi:hypothetical protein